MILRGWLDLLPWFPYRLPSETLRDRNLSVNGNAGLWGLWAWISTKTAFWGLIWG